MFSDSQSFGNSAALLIVAMGCALWGLVLSRLLRRRPAIAWRDRPPVEWPALLPWLAFPLSLLVQIFVHALLQTDPEADPVSRLSNECVARTVSWGMLLLLPLAFRHHRLEDLGLHTAQPARECGRGIALAMVALPPVLALSLAFTALGWRDPDAAHPLLEHLRADHDGQLWPRIAFLAVVLAPLQEELLFRVYLQGTLERVHGVGVALLISSVLFCAVHYERGRPDYLALAPLAFLLGWLYWRRHSYLAVLSAHATFNALNLWLATLLPES